MLMQEHVQLFRYPEVSKCGQSRWPSNCTGFHGHHIMRKEYANCSLYSHHGNQFKRCCENATVKRSLSIVNFDRRIVSMPGTPTDQPFSAHWLLSCEQRSLPCHVGCMHLPNCHPRNRALRLDELRYSPVISGRSPDQRLPPRGKAL